MQQHTYINPRFINYGDENAKAGGIKIDLLKLYDELEDKLWHLESLDRSKKKYGDFLISSGKTIIPEEVLISWERERTSEEVNNGEHSLKNLMCFLKHEVQREEMVVST